MMPIVLGRLETLSKIKDICFFDIPKEHWTLEKNKEFLERLIKQQISVSCVINKIYVKHPSILSNFTSSIFAEAFESMCDDPIFEEALAHALLYSPPYTMSVFAYELEVLLNSGRVPSNLCDKGEYYMFDLFAKNLKI